MVPIPFPQFDFLPLVRDTALLVFFAVGAFYFLKHKIESRGLLILSAIASMTLLMYAVGVSLFQYFVWSKDSFTQILLSAPLASEVPTSHVLRFVIESIGAHEYFLYYAWGHFLLPAFLIIGSSLLCYGVLRLTVRIRPLFFARGEPELLLLGSLVSPWPLTPLVVLVALLLAIPPALFSAKPQNSNPTSTTYHLGVGHPSGMPSPHFSQFFIPIVISVLLFACIRVFTSIQVFFL